VNKGNQGARTIICAASIFRDLFVNFVVLHQKAIDVFMIFLA